jgi:hypothetical protein
MPDVLEKKQQTQESEIQQLEKCRERDGAPHDFGDAVIGRSRAAFQTLMV